MTTESLHPRVRALWSVKAALVAAVVGAVALAADAYLVAIGQWVGVAAFGLVAVAGAGHALVAYRVWRYEVREDSLYLVRGVVTRTDTSVPFVRVQHVDTRRGPAERALGLASVVIYTAGSRGADITVPGLTPERARALRERLRELAVESEDEDAV